MGIKNVQDIVKRIEKKYPKNHAESWDNVGLLVGRKDSEVKKIQISLDATEEVIKKAVENSVDMIITHHPMIFSPVKSITDGNLLGNKVLTLIENKIALYTAHTNLDSTLGGLNDLVCEKLGWNDSRVIEEEYYNIFKLGVYIPQDIYDKTIKIIDKAKLELNGYEGVSYLSDSTERYKKEGEIQESKQYKLEIIGEKGKLMEVLNSIRKVHPYDEAAYEIHPIDNNYLKNGIGRYTTLKEKTSVIDLAKDIKSKLGISDIRLISRDETREIKKIALVNGSGMSFYKKIKRMNIDLFITGDIKYHEALDAIEDGIDLLDIGHYESEHFFHELIEREIGNDVEVLVVNDEAVFKHI